MINFIKWFFEKQLTTQQSEVWKSIITNVMLVITFVYLLLTKQTIEDELKMLLSMVLGFYFSSNKKN